MLFDISKQIHDEMGGLSYRVHNEEMTDKLTGEKTIVQVKKPAIMKELLGTPLFMEFPDDAKLAYKDKLKRSRLANRIMMHDEKEPINFDVDEVKMLKEYCGKSLKIVFIHQIEDFFENSVGPSPEAADYMAQKQAKQEASQRDKSLNTQGVTKDLPQNTVQ